MSLLGKKRIKRDEEDEKVRNTYINVNNLLFKKEYNQMFGIKEEEPENEDNKNNIENTVLISKKNKTENKEIKIIETTICLSIKEKIKSKSYNKGNKKINKEEKSIITLLPVSSGENKNTIEIKEENEEVNEKRETFEKEKNNFTNINDTSIFSSGPLKNPFEILKGDNKEKNVENNNSDKPKFNLFGNILNKTQNEKENENKEIKPQASLFGNPIDNKEKTENKEIKPQISLFGNPIDNKEKTENKEIKPQISLFGNPIDNKEKTENKEIKPQISLFGNQIDNKDNKSNDKNLFSNTNSLFSSNNNQPLFSSDNKNPLFSSNNSLFSSNNNNTLLLGNNKSLFSFNNTKEENNNNTPFFSNNNNISNPFSQIKGETFLQNILNKNNQNKEKSLFGIDNKIQESQEEEEDERDKPKTNYVGEPLKAQDYSNYSKLYNTHINNLFLFNKKQQKFVSKGNGFFSVEKNKDESTKQHQAVIVFRNQTGNKLVEGFLDKKFEKCDILNKNFNFVASFAFIMMNEGSPELGFIKIPFKNEQNAKELKEAFEKAISYLNEK